ncbi:hypothetical protein DMN77_08035 [Paenibacillus sp. 79R4]|nr:hypothetical protein [Paenibacillus sp. 79R4]
MNLEKRLGRNPMDLLMGIQEGKLPTLTASLAVIQASMTKFQHGITAQDVIRIYERYLDAGNSYTDLLPVIMEVFEVSGFFKSDPVLDTAENEALEEPENDLIL